MNRPLFVSAKKGDKFIMFLAPSSTPGVFASLLAPYDEANAIFLLDRRSKAYDFSSIVDTDYRKQCEEKKRLAWTLIDEQNNFREEGVQQVRKQYAEEIQALPKNYIVALEWKKITNPSGWSWDAPKTSKNTNSEPAASPNAAPPHR